MLSVSEKLHASNFLWKKKTPNNKTKKKHASQKISDRRMLEVVSFPAADDKSAGAGCWFSEHWSLPLGNVLADSGGLFNSDGLTGTESQDITIQQG